MKKAKTTMYLNSDTEAAIERYNNTTDKFERDKLYNKFIYPAFNKLVENVIHNRKIYDYGNEDYINTKLDCICYLTDRLDRYTPAKGKAFSYYNRICINFLLQNKIKNDKQKHTKVKIVEIDNDRDVVSEIIHKEYIDDLSEFCLKWAEWGIENVEKLFVKKRDQKIAESIFNLFKNSHRIDKYNKKAIYIQIREQIEVKTHLITNVLNILKDLQQEMYIEFKNSGTRKWKYFTIMED